MKDLRFRKFSALLSLCASAGLLISTGKAQTNNPATTTTTTTTTASTNPVPTPDQPAQTMEKFEVTGSYLPYSSTVTASPVVTIESSDIGQSGATDPLRLLRQLTPFFAGNGNQGTEANNGAAGESYVALRNLTTLVLINGERITGGSSPFQNGTLVDLNTIPTEMIDRIEILKDGASTVYGTDAIGGVVNIILKKNYNGFEAGIRYGSTGDGDYKTREAFIMGGASGDGYSLTVSAQHYENNVLPTTDRSIATLTPKEEAAMGFNPTSAVFFGNLPRPRRQRRPCRLDPDRDRSPRLQRGDHEPRHQEQPERTRGNAGTTRGGRNLHPGQQHAGRHGGGQRHRAQHHPLRQPADLGRAPQ